MISQTVEELLLTNIHTQPHYDHGSRDFRDFRRLPWFLPNAVICRDFAQYKLQLVVLWFQYKINLVKFNK